MVNYAFHRFVLILQHHDSCKNLMVSRQFDVTRTLRGILKWKTEWSSRQNQSITVI